MADVPRNPKTPELGKPSGHIWYWPAWMIEGLLLTVLGAVAIGVPVIGSPIASASFVGWVLAISAIPRFLMGSGGGPRFAGFWCAMLSTALAAAVGLALLGWPVPTDTPVASLLTRFCALQGAILVTGAAEHKYAHTPGWRLMLVSGLVAIAVAAMLWVGWLPISAHTLGLPVGIVFITEGACTYAIAKQANRSIRDWLSKGVEGD
jgi:uncharacterized membrane protein HdeD (DUF308 family)